MIVTLLFLHLFYLFCVFFQNKFSLRYLSLLSPVSYTVRANFSPSNPSLLPSLIKSPTISSSSVGSVSLQCCICWPQIAVSHTTACGLWHGGVPVLRGSGVRLQLGRMGMLSCLHRLLSGRLWALISLHRQRLRSMTSSSLPSLWVCVADGVVPPLTVGCPCASWASCWNCNCRWCCC